MTEKNRLIIHPGFGKTGTTTLQHHLFGRHSEVVCLGKPYVGHKKKLKIEMHRADGYYRKDVYKALSESFIVESRKEGKTIVLSDETLLTNYYLREPIARRLHDLFPEAIVIFTIRNQLRIIESAYINRWRRLYNVPEPYMGRYVGFENWLRFCNENWEKSYLNLVDYHKTISLYESHFGKENVHVLLFEQFKNDPGEFLKTLTGVLGIGLEEALSLLEKKKANPRDSVYSVGYAKLRERLFPSVRFGDWMPFGERLRSLIWRTVEKGPSMNIRLSPGWRELFAERYREGNRALAERYHLPLKDHGYPY